MTDRSPRRFYDGLAAGYHLLYPDWQATVVRQGEALDALVRAECGDAPQRVLDCACGIGTQAVGLARQGHAVTGTDLSPVAAARAVREAAALGTRLTGAAADMRRLPFGAGTFDAVVCADNSVAHLLTAGALEAALGAMHRVLRPGGLLLAGLRDYEQARQSRQQWTPPQRSRTAGGERSVSFQLWDWHEDGERYDFEHFQLIPDGGEDGDGCGEDGGGTGGWQVHVRRTTSWAMSQDQLTESATRAGFTDMAWRRAEESGFFQPLLTARRPY